MAAAGGGVISVGAAGVKFDTDIIKNMATVRNFEVTSKKFQSVGSTNLQKVKLSFCLTKYHAMKTYGTVELELHPLLTSELEPVLVKTTHRNALKSRVIPTTSGFIGLNLR
jgi:hypothetical protein